MAAVEDEVEDRFKDVDMEALLTRAERRPLTLTRKRSVFSAPEFSQRLKGEETVDEGSDLTLTFKVNGMPRPTLRWFKDDEEVKDHARLTVEEGGDGKYSLTLHQVNKGDEAAYRCRAENAEGACSCCFFLTVKGKPKSPKRDSKNSHKRTVSYPTMFSTIVEKVEEEKSAGDEASNAPVSPISQFYDSLTLKGRSSWPSFLGDWAFVNGMHKTRGGSTGSYPSSGSEGVPRDPEDYITDFADADPTLWQQFSGPRADAEGSEPFGECASSPSWQPFVRELAYAESGEPDDVFLDPAAPERSAADFLEAADPVFRLQAPDLRGKRVRAVSPYVDRPSERPAARGETGSLLELKAGAQDKHESKNKNVSSSVASDVKDVSASSAYKVSRIESAASPKGSGDVGTVAADKEKGKPPSKNSQRTASSSHNSTSVTPASLQKASILPSDTSSNAKSRPVGNPVASQPPSTSQATGSSETSVSSSGLRTAGSAISKAASGRSVSVRGPLGALISSSQGKREGSESIVAVRPVDAGSSESGVGSSALTPPPVVVTPDWESHQEKNAMCECAPNYQCKHCSQNLLCDSCHQKPCKCQRKESDCSTASYPESQNQSNTSNVNLNMSGAQKRKDPSALQLQQGSTALQGHSPRTKLSKDRGLASQEEGMADSHWKTKKVGDTLTNPEGPSGKQKKPRDLSPYPGLKTGPVLPGKDTGALKSGDTVHARRSILVKEGGKRPSASKPKSAAQGDNSSDTSDSVSTVVTSSESSSGSIIVKAQPRKPQTASSCSDTEIAKRTKSPAIKSAEKASSSMQIVKVKVPEAAAMPSPASSSTRSSDSSPTSSSVNSSASNTTLQPLTDRDQRTPAGSPPDNLKSSQKMSVSSQRSPAAQDKEGSILTASTTSEASSGTTTSSGSVFTYCVDHLDFSSDDKRLRSRKSPPPLPSKQVTFIKNSPKAVSVFTKTGAVKVQKSQAIGIQTVKDRGPRTAKDWGPQTSELRPQTSDVRRPQTSDAGKPPTMESKGPQASEASGMLKSEVTAESSKPSILGLPKLGFAGLFKSGFSGLLKSGLQKRASSASQKHKDVEPPSFGITATTKHEALEDPKLKGASKSRGGSQDKGKGKHGVSQSGRVGDELQAVQSMPSLITVETKLFHDPENCFPSLCGVPLPPHLNSGPLNTPSVRKQHSPFNASPLDKSHNRNPSEAETTLRITASGEPYSDLMSEVKGKMSVSLSAGVEGKGRAVRQNVRELAFLLCLLTFVGLVCETSPFHFMLLVLVFLSAFLVFSKYLLPSD